MKQQFGARWPTRGGFQGPPRCRLLGAEGRELVRKPQQQQRLSAVLLQVHPFSRALRDICSRRLSPQAEESFHGKAIDFCAVSGAVKGSVAVMAGLSPRAAEHIVQAEVTRGFKTLLPTLSSLGFHLQISK